MSRRITRVTTKSGDDGSTGLAGGRRVSKDHPQIEALGAVDELNSRIGLLRATAAELELGRILESIQQDLFDLGAELAGSGRLGISGEQIAHLEQLIEARNADLPPLEEFALPGGSEQSAHFHIARAACRRAERRVVAAERSSRESRAYLNRLSDLLFVLARMTDRAESAAEALWRGAPSG